MLNYPNSTLIENVSVPVNDCLPCLQLLLVRRLGAYILVFRLKIAGYSVVPYIEASAITLIYHKIQLSKKTIILIYYFEIVNLYCKNVFSILQT